MSYIPPLLSHIQIAHSRVDKKLFLILMRWPWSRKCVCTLRARAAPDNKVLAPTPAHPPPSRQARCKSERCLGERKLAEIRRDDNNKWPVSFLRPRLRTHHPLSAALKMHFFISIGLCWGMRVAMILAAFPFQFGTLCLCYGRARVASEWFGAKWGIIIALQPTENSSAVLRHLWLGHDLVVATPKQRIFSWCGWILCERRARAAPIWPAESYLETTSFFSLY